MKSSIVQDKSYSFALRIVTMAKWLREQKEFEIARQVLRSGTAIGSNVEEALAESAGRISSPKCPLPPKKRGKLITGCACYATQKLFLNQNLSPRS
ncbi:MAG: four helix bundle protein [Limisphaerales bacterium]